MRRAVFLAAGAALLAALAGEARAGGHAPAPFDPVAASEVDPAGFGPSYSVGSAYAVEYREPSIGRGLVYNVPPDPYRARHRNVVRARF